MTPTASISVAGGDLWSDSWFCMAFTGLFGGRWTHLSCFSGFSEQLAAHHPEVGQGQQRDDLGGVLGNASVADLGIAELALEDAVGVFGHGPDSGLAGFDGVEQRVVGAGGVQGLAPAGPHGDVPAHLKVFGFLALVRTLVAGVTEYIGLVAVQQLVHAGDIRDVGGGAHHAVHQPGGRIHPEPPRV